MSTRLIKRDPPLPRQAQTAFGTSQNGELSVVATLVSTLIAASRRTGQSEQAVAYATAAIAVFPVHTIRSHGVCSCTSNDCAAPGKHPWTAKGHTEASTSPLRTETRWNVRPQANIGITLRSLQRAGIQALDSDGSWGVAYLAALYRAGRLPHVLCWQRTGSGGIHLLLPDTGHRAAWKHLGPGVHSEVSLQVDGYILAPGSSHASGRVYDGWHDVTTLLIALLAVSGPDLAEVVLAPAGSLPWEQPIEVGTDGSVRAGLTRAEGYAEATLTQRGTTIAGTKTNRNNAIFVAARICGQQIAAAWISEQRVIDVLTLAAAKTELPSNEVVDVIRKGIKQGKQDGPATLPASGFTPANPRQVTPDRCVALAEQVIRQVEGFAPMLTEQMGEVLWGRVAAIVSFTAKRVASFGSPVVGLSVADVQTVIGSTSQSQAHRVLTSVTGLGLWLTKDQVSQSAEDALGSRNDQRRRGLASTVRLGLLPTDGFVFEGVTIFAASWNTTPKEWVGSIYTPVPTCGKNNGANLPATSGAELSVPTCGKNCTCPAPALPSTEIAPVERAKADHLTASTTCELSVPTCGKISPTVSPASHAAPDGPEGADHCPPPAITSVSTATACEADPAAAVPGTTDALWKTARVGGLGDAARKLALAIVTFPVGTVVRGSTLETLAGVSRDTVTRSLAISATPSLGGLGLVEPSGKRGYLRVLATPDATWWEAARTTLGMDQHAKRVTNVVAKNRAANNLGMLREAVTAMLAGQMPFDGAERLFTGWAEAAALRELLLIVDGLGDEAFVRKAIRRTVRGAGTHEDVAVLASVGIGGLLTEVLTGLHLGSAHPSQPDGSEAEQEQAMLLMPEVEAGDGVEVMPVANMSTGEAQAATEGSIDVMVDVRGAPDRLAAAGNRRDAGPL